MEMKRLTISAVLKDGFKKTFSHFWSCLKGLISLMVIGLGVLVVFLLVNWGWVGTMINQAPALAEQAEACDSSIACFKTIFWPLMSPYIFVFGVSLLIMMMMYLWLTFSVIRYFLKVHDTGKASIRDLFLPLSTVIKIAAAFVLVLLIVIGGLVLLIIPGIYWGMRFSQSQYFIIDKNAGIIESLKMSWAATDGYSLKLFFLYFIVNIIVGLTNGIFFVFLLFTMPMQFIMYACIYRRLTSTHEKIDEAVS